MPADRTPWRPERWMLERLIDGAREQARLHGVKLYVGDEHRKDLFARYGMPMAFLPEGVPQRLLFGGWSPLVYGDDGQVCAVQVSSMQEFEDRLARRHGASPPPESLRENPGPRKLSRALGKYREFYQLEPRDVFQLPARFRIPERAYLLGRGVHVLYASDKLNPTTGANEGWIDYIHEHDAGVSYYMPRPGRDAPSARTVPQWLHGDGDQVLVELGDCLGFAYDAGDGMREVKLSRRNHRLFSIPSGKALVVLSNQPVAVVALAWGGRLGVEGRGIVH